MAGVPKPNPCYLDDFEKWKIVDGKQVGGIRKETDYTLGIPFTVKLKFLITAGIIYLSPSALSFIISAIFNLTKIDPGFLVHIKEIVYFEEELPNSKNWSI